MLGCWVAVSLSTAEAKFWLVHFYIKFFVFLNEAFFIIAERWIQPTNLSSPRDIIPVGRKAKPVH
jgi:hypothetical protein